jgi:hypothetical protein
LNLSGDIASAFKLTPTREIVFMPADVAKADEHKVVGAAAAATLLWYAWAGLGSQKRFKEFVKVVWAVIGRRKNDTVAK